MGDELKFGPLGKSAAHLCVDMQRMFAPSSPWALAWLPRVIPQIAELTAAHPAQTYFTRFIPRPSLQDAKGSWRRFYQKWPDMLLERLDPQSLELVPELAKFAPPAHIVDKPVYSPWPDSDLHEKLQDKGIDTLLVTGGETDICVAATVTGAVDHGYRVIILRDALCSYSDEAHDAMLKVYYQRYSQQVEVTTVAVASSQWRTD